MDPMLRGWLDREVAIANLLHDLRGPVSALQALAELLGPDCPELVSRTAGRLIRLLEAFPTVGNQTHRVDLGELLNLPTPAPVVLRVPPEMSQAAVEQVPALSREVEVDERVVVLRLKGVPAEEWNPEATRNPSTGARLRVASRLAGVLSLRYISEGERGTVHLRFPRQPVS